jgi:hypothetical protein
VHAGAGAAWLTVSVWFATVTVPVRDAVVGFEATTKVIEPFPSRAVPPVTDIQDTFAVASQAQPVGAVTVAPRVPPAAPTD